MMEFIPLSKYWFMHRFSKDEYISKAPLFILVNAHWNTVNMTGGLEAWLETELLEILL